MYNRLISFVNKHKMLYKYQFGFRSNHSTNMALIILIDRITSAIDKGETVVGVFLDFRKAFDTVDHSILLKKLNKLGIRGVAYTFLENYLSNRCQFIEYGNLNSNRENINCGVPQGSILGPLLFLLYINDITNVSKLLLPIIFADDTNIFLSGKCIKETIEIMNIEIGKINEWLQVNRLSLNIEKTHFMIFSSIRKKFTYIPDIEINGYKIKCVEQTKFIGVVLDSKLRWERHITSVKTKIARGLGILNKAKKFFSLPTLITLYYSFVYPHYIYCIEVWGKAANIHMDSLFKLQKRIVRSITSSPYKTESIPLFKRLKLLTLKQIYKYRVNIFMFRFTKDMLPSIFQDMFIQNYDVSNFNTRNKFSLRIPIAKTNTFKNTIRHQGVTEWNQITRLINYNCSIHTFKNRLKNTLIHSDMLN